MDTLTITDSSRIDLQELHKIAKFDVHLNSVENGHKSSYIVDRFNQATVEPKEDVRKLLG